ncbi:MAG: class I SAM-dependent methyltransferase [Nitrospirae bacterium]|nr:class I SAM-dependent methyltransferase [Nitrospirota bacterium]MBI3593365.1 class I SAM-dependent methyltransferase [Nitrospirota bacterium]
MPALLKGKNRAGRLSLSLAKWLVQKLLNRINNPPIRVLFWDGSSIVPKGCYPLGTVTFHDPAMAFRVFADPELYFGDAYSTRRLEVEGDLVSFLEIIYRALSSYKAEGFLPRSLYRISNSLEKSRENIHHHYDIGNSFYRLWLDKNMNYTSGYFPDPEMTLEDAQVAKMDHVCRKLLLKPGDTVIEAGCGWGGLALHMARHYGVKVQAYNISHEQITYARQRAENERMSHQVEFIEDDYRNIKGQCDAFVSIGMLEHVGRENYRQLGTIIDKVLLSTGRGLIHSIGRNVAGPIGGWIERRIFPGGYPPTLREMMDIFEPQDFSVLDIENLRLHYAKTLEHWLARYEGASKEVSNLFDETFMRAWRFYLAGSLVSFRTGTLQLFQILFTRGRYNEIPWSREHLYRLNAGEREHSWMREML